MSALHLLLIAAFIIAPSNCIPQARRDLVIPAVAFVIKEGKRDSTVDIARSTRLIEWHPSQVRLAEPSTALLPSSPSVHIPLQ